MSLIGNWIAIVKCHADCEQVDLDNLRIPVELTDLDERFKTLRILKEQHCSFDQMELMLGGPVTLLDAGRESNPGFFKHHNIVIRSDLVANPNSTMVPNKYLNDLHPNHICDLMLMGPVLVGPKWCFKEAVSKIGTAYTNDGAQATFEYNSDEEPA